MGWGTWLGDNSWWFQQPRAPNPSLGYHVIWRWFSFTTWLIAEIANQKSPSFPAFPTKLECQFSNCCFLPQQCQRLSWHWIKKLDPSDAFFWTIFFNLDQCQWIRIGLNNMDVLFLIAWGKENLCPLLLQSICKNCFCFYVKDLKVVEKRHDPWNYFQTMWSKTLNEMILFDSI